MVGVNVHPTYLQAVTQADKRVPALMNRNAVTKVRSQVVGSVESFAEGCHCGRPLLQKNLSALPDNGEDDPACELAIVVRGLARHGSASVARLDRVVTVRRSRSRHLGAWHPGLRRAPV